MANPFKQSISTNLNICAQFWMNKNPNYKIGPTTRNQKYWTDPHLELQPPLLSAEAVVEPRRPQIERISCCSLLGAGEKPLAPSSCSSSSQIFDESTARERMETMTRSSSKLLNRNPFFWLLLKKKKKKKQVAEKKCLIYVALRLLPPSLDLSISFRSYLSVVAAPVFFLWR